MRDRDISSFVQEARDRINREVKLPEGYVLEWGGQFENLERSRLRLMIVVPATLLMIFLLLLMSLKSVKDVLVIYTGIPLAKFRKLMEEKMALLRMDPGFASRYVNDGFSGGEKKRLEMLQMAVLNPAMAILDETDSGLDIDALKNVAEGINATLSPEMGVLMITHYQRMLNYVKPDFVHVMVEGRIIRSGGPELALELEEKGYEQERELADA